MKRCAVPAASDRQGGISFRDTDSNAGMNLTDDQLDRYARHIILKEIGGDGQKRLLGATVAIIGAGGIGSPLIQYLAAAGIGRLVVIDDDRVALSNLQRQTLFTTRDIGHAKVVAAANAVQRLNPDVALKPIDRRLDADNAERLLAGASVVVDGSDSFATRLTVADTAQALRIPLVSAAVGQFEGQLAVYRGWEPDKPCYRCLVGDAPDRPDVSCADQGVLGALTGVMGSLAAIEAVRQIVPFGEETAGKLLLVDALAFRFRTIALPKDPGCRCHAA
jgi:molybdopterin-synthase adenylyltransferase